MDPSPPNPAAAAQQPPAAPAAADEPEAEVEAADEPEPEPETEPAEPTKRERQLAAAKEELKLLQENLLESTSPILIRSYMDYHAELHCEIARLSVEPSDADDAPDFLCCPITLALFTDPVIDSNTGRTYERANIESWIAARRGRATCPVTRQQMGTLVLNRAVGDAAEQWCVDNDVLVSAAAPTAASAAAPAAAPTPAPYLPVILGTENLSRLFRSDQHLRAWIRSADPTTTTYSLLFVPFIHAIFMNDRAIQMNSLKS